MLREKAAAAGFGKDNGFRWRGTDVSRVEGFSDNVFGFALTLLVVSLEVPKTFTDLEETFRGFIAFALAFALLFSIWFYHYKYFRRYGLEDATVIWLNALLLFVMLFFVYPLKFLFSFLVKLFSGQSTLVHLPDGTTVPSILPEQWQTLMIAYGVGLITIYAILGVLHIHALRKGEELQLSPRERLLTKAAVAGHFANCAIAFLSILIISIGGLPFVIFSGMTYALIGPVQAVVGTIYRRRLRALPAE